MERFAIILVYDVTQQEYILPTIHTRRTLPTALRHLRADQPAGCRYVVRELLPMVITEYVKVINESLGMEYLND